MFVVDLVEGKAHTFQAGPLKFEDLGGNNVGLLLLIMKSSFATGRHVILDYGFCVLKGSIRLRKRGIIACYVINNRRYWNYVVSGK